MIKNYFKLTWRNLKKNKTFSAINIFGLSVGLTCCMLISLYIYNELSYDNYHQHKDRIFLLGTDFIMDGKSEPGANTSAPVGRTMQMEFPEIREQARIMRLFLDDKTLFQYRDVQEETKTFYETNGFLADSNIFHILSYQFTEGDPQTALNTPASIVIEEEIAAKLFDDQQALGKRIQVSSSTNGENEYVVSGVFKKHAIPSHLDANFFLSFKGGNMESFVNNADAGMLNNNMFYTYLLLKQGADAKNLQAKFPAFVETHMGADLKIRGDQRKHFLVPVEDIYLHSGIKDDIITGGNKNSLFVLASVALLTLLIACINFMNLSTASSSKRAAEVGVRKVLGAERSSLLKQFLGESVLMAMISMLLAVVFVQFLQPLFELVAGKKLYVESSQYILLVIVFFGLSILTGLLAGLYPAFYLSSFKPIKVLKGKFTNSLSVVSIRKAMVVFQFVIAVVLITASLVMSSQMKYMQSKELGFNKDHQIVIPLRTATAKSSIPALKNEISNTSYLSGAGSSMSYPGIFHPQDWLMYKQGESMNSSKQIFINMVDDDFLQTLGVQLLAGRLFSEKFPADTLSRFVINEEAVQQFGFASAEDAIGKWMAFDWEGEQIQFTIIGVVKNFHFKDFHAAIEPFAFRMYNNTGFNYLVTHVNEGNIKPALSFLESSWKKLVPGEPFEYSFLDLDFQKNYEADNRQARLINSFTAIAIIISCLGLFALATFSAEQRTKEIGIRKVMGASVLSVVRLLSGDFIKLVLIAVCIAVPLAWYGMNQWLENFSYRVNISWQVFALTTITTLLIAFITISFQAVKSAIANPVKNLRTE